MKIPLKDQFAYPTVRQDHNTSNWDTAIGRRNYLITVEKLTAALMSNPSVPISVGEIPDIVAMAMVAATEIYHQLEVQ